MMKSFPLFFALIASCAALSIPPVEANTTRYLEARVPGQQLINPDNEPPYLDATTGATMEKSRILSGVGPDAADRRYFDWDESCLDAGQRERIAAAWVNFQPLTTGTSNRLATLRDNLPVPPENKGTPNQENREYIFKADPAYTQMFKARDTGLQDVQDGFTSITDNVVNFPARGGTQPAALRFICNADDHVQNGQGSSLCGSGAEASQAQTIVPQSPLDTAIEQRYRFQTSSSIVFCPVFFDDNAFPNINAIWTREPADFTLDNVDCRERIMLHEYLHLPWTKNMNPRQDYVGYLKAADAAAKLGWGTVKSTPDCYAWYALYSAFNNEHTGCGTDIWPSDVTKPVATT